jgi:hypothetical protein
MGVNGKASEVAAKHEAKQPLLARRIFHPARNSSTGHESAGRTARGLLPFESSTNEVASCVTQRIAIDIGRKRAHNGAFSQRANGSEEEIDRMAKKLKLKKGKKIAKKKSLRRSGVINGGV